MTPAARLLSKVIAGPDGCWIYTGSVMPRGGYGSFGIRKGVSVLAHRASYQFAVGPIPVGAQLDHECHTRDKKCPGGACIHRRCINPGHLAPVTSRENSLRSLNSTPGRNAAKTHCVNGHEFTPENTRLYIGKSGYENRECRTCRRSRKRTPRQLAAA